MQQSVQQQDLSARARLWRAVVKLDFISKFFAWLMEFLARVTEPMATFAIVYVIICAGVPVAMNIPLYTISLALIIGSPELLLVGAIKIAARELASGNKRAWWLMASCFVLLGLTALTVSDLFMWHWSLAAVNVLMGFRCLAGIGYTLARGICTDNEDGVNLKPGSQVNLLLEQFTVNITSNVQETVNQAVNQTNQTLLAEVNLIHQGLLAEVNQQHQRFVTEVHSTLQDLAQQQRYLHTTVNGISQNVQEELQAAVESLGQQSQLALDTAVERLEHANSRRMEAVYTRLEEVRVTLESSPSLPVVNAAGSPLRLPSRVPSRPGSERVHTSTVNPASESLDGSLEGTKVNQGLLFAVNHYRTHQIMPTLATIMAATACGKTLASKIKNRAEAELGLKASNED